jgi:2-iminobutanoate/2-iminopropanoate deaminase
MPKKVIAGDNCEGLPLSEAVMAGDFLFVSGMVGFDGNGGIVTGGVAAETDQILKDLAKILRHAGASLEDIVKANVFLTDADDFPAFNQAYAKHFPKDPPARIGVVVALTIDAKVEMDFIAYIDPDS